MGDFVLIDANVSSTAQKAIGDLDALDRARVFRVAPGEFYANGLTAGANGADGAVILVCKKPLPDGAVSDEAFKLEILRWELASEFKFKMTGFGDMRARAKLNVAAAMLSPRRRALCTPLRQRLIMRGLVVVDLSCGSAHSKQLAHFLKRLSVNVNEQLYYANQLGSECGYICVSVVVRILRRMLAGDRSPLGGVFEGLTIAQIRDMNSKLLGLLGQTEHGTCDCKENSSCIVCDWVPREGRGADAVLRNVHEISGNAIRALIRHEFEDDEGRKELEKQKKRPGLSV